MSELLKRIEEYSLEEIMGERFGRYCKTIILDRALPDVRDGLKPVQRRILYGMYKSGNTYDKKYRKSAKAVGEIMGNYHPHGDSSIYDAMVRMSQDWKMMVPYIDMHGNNGSMDGDGAAAMRYTEARLSKISNVLLNDINKDTVEMAPNYDDTLMEPVVLPAGFPNLLVNGSTGISAGYATNIPPHNLGEVIDACIKRIDSPNCRLDSILEVMKGPDFPTGGVIVPIHRLKIIMIPKWIVVIPSAVHTGRKIGVKIRQAGVISINVPTIRRIILIRNKITNLLLLTESSAVDTSSGILVNAITHDMMLDTPIRKMMIPVISALSRRIFGSSLILIDLYTNNDRSRLYTTATTEPSVAVKIPKMIPPITITIRSRQGRA